MKIVHVTAGIQETCGVSQYVVNTARAQQASGYDVTIVTTMTCGYAVDDLKVVLATDPTEALDSIVGNGERVIVHLHSMWSSYLHKAARWCRKRNVPYVISPHGATTPWAMHYKWWKKKPAWWLYQRNDFKGAAAFHVTVPDEEDDIRRLGFSQSVVVAPLGADVNQDFQDFLTFRNSQIPFHDIVFVGRLHPVKNLVSLVRAWSILVQKKAGHHCPPIFSTCFFRLVVAGSNDVGHQEELVELAKSLGLKVIDFSHDLEFGKKTIDGGGEVPVETFQKRLADCDADVVFAGPVYSAAKDWMYRHAWVSVLPSHSENFGGVVVESLAQGTPVIASKGTPWQALEKNGCGWWVDATPDKLAEALWLALQMSMEDRSDRSAKAKDLVRREFSWESSARKVTSLYETILSSPNS